MSRIARVISESGVYHILFRGVNQQNIFEETADFEKLKDAKKGTSPRGPVAYARKARRRCSYEK